MGIFGGLANATQLEDKLASKGVTTEMVNAAGSDAATLVKIAEAFGVGMTDAWIESMIQAENVLHMAFFGQTYDLSKMREVLAQHGLSKITFWKQVGLEVHFLPSMAISKDMPLDAWKVRPEQWFWDMADARRLFYLRDGNLVIDTTVALHGIVVLIDTRKKPDYNDGKQKFARDGFMGAVIGQLRKEGKLAHYQYGPQTSRFGISPNEWEEHLKVAWAEGLGLEPSQLRLETTIEANMIPQIFTNMPRKNDGQTNTWCWYDEYLDNASSRLVGGGSVCGGLASVYYGDSGYRWGNDAVRPLGVLARA